MKSSQIRSAKSLLRKRLRKILAGIKPSTARRKSRKILSRFFKTEDFKKARKIFTYMALPGEVQTKGLIFKAIKMKKRIFAPRILVQKKEIVVYEILRPSTDLRLGFFGVPEPKAVKARKARPWEMDVVIVPGLGFDRKGGRIGRGQGYFDRFLKKTKKAKKIGFAFREQVVKKIPIQAHDVRVDRLITD